jgi:hypothetical protein
MADGADAGRVQTPPTLGAIDPKDTDRFRALYDSLEHYHERLVSSVTATAGALLVVIGWAMTSDSLAARIAAHPRLRLLAVAVLVAALAIYLGTSYRLFRESKRMDALLGALGYLEPSCYQQHRISGRYFACGMVLNSLLFALCAFVIARPF